MSTRAWIVVFAFVIGFATTIAEPALIAIAHKAAVISDGQIHALTLRLVVALSVGFAIVIGVIRNHGRSSHSLVHYRWLRVGDRNDGFLTGGNCRTGLRLRRHYHIDGDSPV